MVAAVESLVTRDPTKHTNFRGVYPKRNGAAFEARFKMGSVLRFLGVRPTALAAAELVAEEYARWYGPGWWRHLRPDDRRRHPWRVVKWAAPSVSDPKSALPGRGRLPGCRLAAGGCEADKRSPWPVVGYALEVCEWGRPTIVGDHNAGAAADDWPTRRVVWVWPTAAEADAAFRLWRRDVLPRRWGLLSPLSVWR